jgi:hypothetical protein
MSEAGRRDRRDPHSLLEKWLLDGANDELPRAVAVHASLCNECRARIAAFDMLTATELDRAGFPPLRVAAIPTHARRRVAMAAGGVVALSAVAVAAGAGWRLPNGVLGTAPATPPTQEVLGNTGRPEASPRITPSASPTASEAPSAEVTASASPAPVVPSALAPPPTAAPTASPRPRHSASPTPRASIVPPTASAVPTPEVTPVPPTPEPTTPEPSPSASI